MKNRTNNTEEMPIRDPRMRSEGSSNIKRVGLRPQQLWVKKELTFKKLSHMGAKLPQTAD